MATKVFGRFETSDWRAEFEEDCRKGTRIRLASGFMDVRGATELASLLPSTATVSILLGIRGCSGPDVTRALAQSNVTVRGSKIPEFHWKLALIESPTSRSAYVGSANLTSKGLSGRGELMVRLSGAALDDRAWESLVSNFEEYFDVGTTLSGADFEEMLSQLCAQEGRRPPTRRVAHREHLRTKARGHERSEVGSCNQGR